MSPVTKVTGHKGQSSNSGEHARIDTLCVFPSSSHSFAFLFTSMIINSAHISYISLTFRLLILLLVKHTAVFYSAIMLIHICCELHPVAGLDHEASYRVSRNFIYNLSDY